MYTIILDQGIVIRDSDGKIVAPNDVGIGDPDFQAYQEWVNQGNQPTILNTAPSQ
jgi:hypothetical protein